LLCGTTFPSTTISRRRALQPAHYKTGQHLKKKRLHILQLINLSDIGGAEQMLLSLAKSLDPTNFRVGVACLHGGGRLGDEVQRLGLPFYSLEARNPFCLALKFIRAIKQEKIDLVQTHGARAELLGSIIARLCGVRCLISTLHDIFGFENRAKKFANHITDHFIDRYVAVSRIASDLAMKNFQISRPRIQIIENGIVAGQFWQKEETQTLYRQLGISPRQRMIVTVANLRPVKGHIHILRAVALMSSEERKELRFCFVGADFSGGEVQRAAKSLGVEDSIIFAGFQAEISLYLQAADVFLLASESEGSSFSILEAMAAGCPVIAANVGAIAEIIEDHENGILIPPKSPAAIKEAVLSLLSNQSLREKLCTRGLETVSSRFSLERMVQQYASLYQQVWEKV
jgi:glycosyltransferase involved in cell wall biosynthesis